MEIQESKFDFRFEHFPREVGPVSCLFIDNPRGVDSAQLSFHDHGITFLLEDKKNTAPVADRNRYVRSDLNGWRLVVSRSRTEPGPQLDNSPFHDIMEDTDSVVLIVGVEMLNFAYQMIIPWFVENKVNAGRWNEGIWALSMIVMMMGLIKRTGVPSRRKDAAVSLNIMESYEMHVMLNARYGYHQRDHEKLGTEGLWNNNVWINKIRSVNGIVSRYDTLPTRSSWTTRSKSLVAAKDPTQFYPITSMTYEEVFMPAVTIVLSQIIPWFVVASHIGDALAARYVDNINVYSERNPEMSEILFLKKKSTDPTIDEFKENPSPPKNQVASLGCFLDLEYLGWTPSDVYSGMDVAGDNARDGVEADSLWAYTQANYMRFFGDVQKSPSKSSGSSQPRISLVPSKSKSKSQSKAQSNLRASSSIPLTEQGNSPSVDEMMAGVGSSSSSAAPITSVQISDTGIGSNISVGPRQKSPSLRKSLKLGSPVDDEAIEVEADVLPEQLPPLVRTNAGGFGRFWSGLTNTVAAVADALGYNAPAVQAPAPTTRLSRRSRSASSSRKSLPQPEDEPLNLPEMIAPTVRMSLPTEDARVSIQTPPEIERPVVQHRGTPAARKTPPKYVPPIPVGISTVARVNREFDIVAALLERMSESLQNPSSAIHQHLAISSEIKSTANLIELVQGKQ